MLRFPVLCAVFFANFVFARGSFEWLLCRGDIRDAVTEGGIVRGRVINEEYVAFLGIPYAAPPIGINRFKVRAILVIRITHRQINNTLYAATE